MKKSYIVPSERVKVVFFSDELCQTSTFETEEDSESVRPGWGGDMGEGEFGAVKQHSTWDNEW